MDIIKSILHVFKKSDNAFKIMHPETESAQITDWNQGIVNTLASTALSGLVNTLTSDSLLAKMIQKVLEATGVKYSLGQNGYVCFGSLVGGLIIQWGKERTNSSNRAVLVTLPISANNILIAIASNTDNNDAIATAVATTNGSSLYIHTWDSLDKDYANDLVAYIVVSI